MMKIKLKKIAKVLSGSTAPKDNEFSENNGKPFIRAGHLEELCNGKSLMELPKIEESVAQNRKMVLVPENTILFAKSGMSILKNRVYKTTHEAYIVNHLAAIICSNEIEPDYLYYFFRANPPSRLVLDSSYPSIRLSDIGEIDIDLPSKAIQKKISKLLKQAEEIIFKRKAQIEALDQLTQSVFLEMFGDPLLNPKGWKKESFSYFAKIDTVMIKDFTEYGELIHVGIENIEKDSGRIVNCRTVAEDKIVSGKYLFNEKHIIYSKIRPYLNKVATPNFKGVCSADAYPILVDETKASRHFFAFLLRSKAFLNHVNQHSDRTNIPKVNKNQLLSFEGICPPLELQNKFSKVVEKIEEQRELLIQGLHELEKNFNSLMQRAFKGELFND